MLEVTTVDSLSRHLAVSPIIKFIAHYARRSPSQSARRILRPDVVDAVDLVLTLRGGRPENFECLNALDSVRYSKHPKVQLFSWLCRYTDAVCSKNAALILIKFLVHGQVTIILVVSVGLSVCLCSFSQPSLIRF